MKKGDWGEERKKSKKKHYAIDRQFSSRARADPLLYIGYMNELFQFDHELYQRSAVAACLKTFSFVVVNEKKISSLFCAVSFLYFILNNIAKRLVKLLFRCYLIEIKNTLLHNYWEYSVGWCHIFYFIFFLFALIEGAAMR